MIKISSINQNLRWLKTTFNNSKEVKTKTSLLKRFWAFRNGFFIDTIILCRINKKNRHEFLSDKKYLELHPINKAYSTIIDNKLYLPFLFKETPEVLPRYFYFIDKGRVVILNKNLLNHNNIPQLCKDMKRIVLKPCYSSYSNGFYKLEYHNGAFFLNNIIIEENELLSLIRTLNNYIVTEYVIQHSYSLDINESSVNSIRLLCIWDNELEEFYIARAFHQFGLKGNPADNIGSSHGGILVAVDPKTGITKEYGIIKRKKSNEEILDLTNHPDSQKPIVGLQIPMWQEVTGKILSILNNLSFLKYVGIDLAITQDEFKILETNSLTTLSTIQLDEGLLKDERNKIFFNSITP